MKKRKRKNPNRNKLGTLEQFSIECRKTKTKVITEELQNQSRTQVKTILANREAK